jgi:periplasmic divalent cation tolerance protein
MSEFEFVVVLTTAPAEGTHAATLARALVEGHLAACVNVMPAMQSLYRWQGAVEEAPEHQLIIKTTAARVAALREAIRQLHPYELPEFIVLPVADGAPSYLEWISGSVRPSRP